MRHSGIGDRSPKESKDLKIWDQCQVLQVLVRDRRLVQQHFVHRGQRRQMRQAGSGQLGRREIETSHILQRGQKRQAIIGDGGPIQPQICQRLQVLSDMLQRSVRGGVVVIEVQERKLGNVGEMAQALVGNLRTEQPQPAERLQSGQIVELDLRSQLHGPQIDVGNLPITRRQVRSLVDLPIDSLHVDPNLPANPQHPVRSLLVANEFVGSFRLRNRLGRCLAGRLRECRHHLRGTAANQREFPSAQRDAAGQFRHVNLVLAAPQRLLARLERILTARHRVANLHSGLLDQHGNIISRLDHQFAVVGLHFDNDRHEQQRRKETRRDDRLPIPPSPRRCSRSEWHERFHNFHWSLKSLGRLLGHHPCRHLRQFRRDILSQRRQRQRRFLSMSFELRNHIVRLKRRLAGQQEMQRAAEAINIRANVRRMRVLGLLRRDVIRRPHHAADCGEVCGVRVVAAVARLRGVVSITRVLANAATECRLRDEPRQSEIQNPHLPLGREHQVVRLDVAMDHPLLVSVLQPLCRLSDALARFGDRHRPAMLHNTREVGSLDELHHEEVNVARLLGVVGRDDVGMSQLRRRLHFAPKPLDRLRLPDQLRVDELDRHRPIHQPMLGPIDVSHAAATDQLDDAITRMVPQLGGQVIDADGLARLHK